jgi:hypothetical protein
MSDTEFNVGKAARAAGYRGNGQGVRLLQNPRIARLIGKLIKERNEAAKITPARVLQELMAIGLQNAQDYLDADGRPRPIHELPREVAASIRRVSVRETYEETEDGRTFVHVEHKYDPWDKPEPLMALAKHVKLIGDFPDQINILAIKWDDLFERIVDRPDPIEQQIANAKLVENK